MGMETESVRSRAPSDAGSVTGSFTGSLGGASSVLDGPKKRGRKKKADKDREDASTRGGAGADGRSTRVGSADIDGASVRGGGGGAGGGAGGAGGNDEAGDEEEEQDIEGELLGGTEGFLDLATEKKNLAYVLHGLPGFVLVIWGVFLY